jgi:hypothetical protein
MEQKNQKKFIINELRLNYYNTVLYEKGVITEAERNKMKNLISTSQIPTKKKKSQGYEL